jgi:division protein CdvB (Snf7/Vps24/ESCRT-III family)
MATKIENDEVIPDEELNKIIEEINNEEDKRLKVIVDEYQQLTQNGFSYLIQKQQILLVRLLVFH